MTAFALTRRAFTAGIVATAALALSVGTALAQDAPLKVGMIATLSGPPAALGNQARDGFLLALEQMDGKLGGRTVDLTVEDDELKPDVAQLKARGLVENGADFVVGTIFSNMLQAIYKPITGSETFLISPNAGPSTFAGKNCSPYFFVTSYQNDQNAEVLGEYANEKGYKRVFVLAPNYQAGRDQAQGFKKNFKGEIAGEVFTTLGAQDFSAELARIADAKPDALFTFMPGGMGVRLIKQFRAAGLADSIDVLSTFTTDETTLPGQQDAALDFYSAGAWAPDLDNEANKKFVSAFEEKYGYVPGSYAAHAYDTALLIDSAVKAVGGDVSDKDAVREALRKADFPSVRGKFSFGPNHYPVQDFYLTKVVKRDDGKYATAIDRAVQPDYADGYAAECKM